MVETKGESKALLLNNKCSSIFFRGLMTYQIQTWHTRVYIYIYIYKYKYIYIYVFKGKSYVSQSVRCPKTKKNKNM